MAHPVPRCRQSCKIYDVIYHVVSPCSPGKPLVISHEETIVIIFPVNRRKNTYFSPYFSCSS